MIRKKNVSRIIVLTMFTSILILSSALMSCSRILPDSDSGEYAVPDTYAIYTDKNGLFSISYPSDWKIPDSASTLFRDESASLIEYWNDKNARNIPETKDEWRLLSAIKDNGTMMNLSVYRLLQGEPTKENFYYRALQNTNWKASLQETLRIAGREVAVFRLNEWVISAVIVNQTVWVTSCGRDNQSEKDYQIIVRSLRVVK